MSKQVNYDAMESNDSLKSNKSNEITFIPSGCEIRQGLLVLTDACRIDGRFFGTILAKDKIIVGENAVVKGEVICSSADIYGTMEGNIIVGEMLSFMSTAIYSGDIKVHRLCVEDGSKFEGCCQMISKDEFTKFSGEFNDKVAKQYPPVSADVEKKKGEKVKVEFSTDAQKAI